MSNSSRMTITFRGNLVAEPERKSSAHGEFTTFRVAVNERRWDSRESKFVDGQSSFINVAAFNDLGRNTIQSLHRGMPVVVHGSLRVNEWHTATNETRHSPEVRADSVGHDLQYGVATFMRTRNGLAVVSASESGNSSQDDASTSDPGAMDAAAYDTATGQVFDEVTGEVIEDLSDDSTYAGAQQAG